MADPQVAPTTDPKHTTHRARSNDSKDDTGMDGWTAIVAVIGMLSAVTTLFFLLKESLRSLAGYPTGLTILCFSLATWLSLKLADAKEQRRRERLQSILGVNAQSDYFERLVNINVENLSAYYVTVKGHANKSFLTSIFVGLAGFVMIGIGIYLSVTSAKNAPSVVTLSGVSGIATEFISAVFFYLYSKTVRQMKEYHDSLLSVQNILLSFKLVGDTSDPSEKSRMVQSMLEYLVGRQHPVVGPPAFGDNLPPSGKQPPA